MVDVFVRLSQAPDFGVFREVGAHIFVDELLEVVSGFAKGADDDVGADASFERDVSVWIVE